MESLMPAKRILTAALTLLLAVSFAAPTRVSAQPASLWVAQSGAASAPGSSCGNPGYVGNTNVAIQAAVDAAPGGAIVHICRGTYSINSTITLTGKSIVLIGEGSSRTYLDGGATNNPDGTWLSGGVRIILTDSDLAVQKMTFQKGHACDGGAINAGTVSAFRTTFKGNSSNCNGGAISATTVTAANSIFKRNNAGNGGGAIFGVSATVARSTFAINSAKSTGGAIYVDNATILGSYFTRNFSRLGGAVSAELVVAHSSIFSGNRTVDPVGCATPVGPFVPCGRGGAIYSESAAILYTGAKNIFRSNKSSHGGAMYILGCTDLRDAKTYFFSHNAFAGNSVNNIAISKAGC